MANFQFILTPGEKWQRKKGEKRSTGCQSAALAQIIEHQIKKITFKLSQVLNLLWLREKNNIVREVQKLKQAAALAHMIEHQIKKNNF